VVDPQSALRQTRLATHIIFQGFIAGNSKKIYRILRMAVFAEVCEYSRAVIDIRQVEGEGDRRNASRNRGNRAGTSFLFSFGQLVPSR
jgi:hypothetical protein